MQVVQDGIDRAACLEFLVGINVRPAPTWPMWGGICAPMCATQYTSPDPIDANLMHMRLVEAKGSHEVTLRCQRPMSSGCVHPK
jgi:hypothetical protein